jgi:glycosyltransferase involved in cell wall biosynthesis
MRVLITPEWYPWPDRPLFGVFCREQARAVAEPHDVVVLTWSVDPTLRVPYRLEIADEEGLLTYRVRFARPRGGKAGFGFKLLGCIQALIRLRRVGWIPDVIHAHEYAAASTAVPLGALMGAPVVVSEHYSGFALGSLTASARRRARWGFEHAALVCPVSENLARHIGAVAPRARLEAVPNVVDTDTFRPAEDRRPGSSPRLVTVGSLVEIKGHRHLIGALSELRAQGHDVLLTIVGDGPLRATLERHADDLGVRDLVVFAGVMDKPAVAASLREADVFVLPSLWENMPCAVLEALSTGLPVVATRVGGLCEVVGPREGLLVPASSPEALADGLGRMLKNRAEYEAGHLRALAVARFGYAAIAHRWTHLYTTLVAQQPRWKRVVARTLSVPRA